MIYEGNFKNNKYSGQGKHFTQNGLKYEGIWENDKPNGYGKLYKKNKMIFEGFFTHELKNGMGKEYDENGNIIREGLWSNGLYLNYRTLCETYENEKNCCICMENRRNVIIKCNHFVLCNKCSRLVNECPLCRTEYETKDIREIYLS